MLSICTQFYEKDYTKIPAFIESAIKAVKCDYEIIILDNRFDKSRDVFTECISSYMDMCKLKYINNNSVDVLTARKKLVEASSGDYVWFVNVGDELTGNITTSILRHSHPDIIFFSGYDEANLVKIGVDFTERYKINKNNIEKMYVDFSDWAFGTWSYWFNVDFIRWVFDSSLKMNSTYIEDILIKGVSISYAQNVIVSPEIFYVKKPKDSDNESAKMTQIDFEKVFVEIEQARGMYENNDFVIRILNDDRLVKRYAQKILSNFSGTDQEMLNVAERFSKLFNLSGKKVYDLLHGTDIFEYDGLNILRLKYLCGVDILASKLKIQGKELPEVQKVGGYVYSVYGFDNLSIHKPTLTICVTCYDGDYYKTEQLIDDIRSNHLLDFTKVLVINNCIDAELSKRNDVEYIDTHENLFSYRSRLLGTKNTETDYIWFVDGDDKINISLDLQLVLSSFNTDIINVGHCGVTENRQFESNESLCNYVMDSVNDMSLHRVFISKKIYKKFGSLPDDTVHSEGDAFLNVFSMLNADSIAFYDVPGIYNYIESDHNVSESVYVGLDKIIESAKSRFPYRIYKRFLDMQMYTVSKNLSPEQAETLNGFQYPVNFFDKDFSLNLPIEDKCVDIIYIYYGLDLKKELDYLNGQVKCKHNIIVIDLLQGYSFTDVDVIREDSFHEALVRAVERIRSNYVWIVESYKKVYPFTGVHLENHSVYFTDAISDYNPLVRNNTIFVKEDFLNFLNCTESLCFDGLSSVLYEFAKRNNFVKSINSIVDADVFDERFLNFTFIDLNDSLKNSCIAKLCFDNVKSKFRDSNVFVYNQDSFKSLIEGTNIPQVSWESIKSDSHKIDILRLLALKGRKKTIYLDLGLYITDKTAFLKELSTYPTFGQNTVDYDGNLKVCNEFMWSLGGSSFINENISLYKNNLASLTDDFDATAMTIDKFGGKFYGNHFNVLGLSTFNVIKNDFYLYFNLSRFQYPGDKKEIKIGLMLQEYSTLEYMSAFINKNKLDALYVLCDWRYAETSHGHIDECEVTDICIYKNIDDTVKILTDSIKNQGIQILEVVYGEELQNVSTSEA